uniref:ATP synthase F0 subunit 8 n=1 Tax=Archispirostreptus gigas TaxID=184086 RepID=UPI001FF0E863|nr:ATP synthase F0 subunit 8 [Archispirostreptus gigas]UOF70481.1 ATP synthase F0 subunit 8 [Archispirostreptus gigas]
MPQMFPMSWTNMFVMFIIMYIMTTILMNYIYTHWPMNFTPPLTKTKFTWKW